MSVILIEHFKLTLKDRVAIFHNTQYLPNSAVPPRIVYLFTVILNTHFGETTTVCVGIYRHTKYPLWRMHCTLCRYTQQYQLSNSADPLHSVSVFAAIHKYPLRQIHCTLCRYMPQFQMPNSADPLHFVSVCAAIPNTQLG